MNISGKTFIVTGGSSGLGAACVRQLCAAGARVVIADLNEASGVAIMAGHSVAERHLPTTTRFVKTNVTDADNVQAAINEAINSFGGLHGVINCAGIATATKVISSSRGPHDLGLFSKVIQVNLIGSFNVIRLAAQAMSQREPTESGERGVIVNTASVAAFDGQIGQSAYSASKGGIVGMTLPIARELASVGIRVMTIAPGIFDTPMLAGLPEPARISLGQQVPFPSRLGQPEEFAALVQHIVENEMLNGEVIRLDGAIRMAPR